MQRCFESQSGYLVVGATPAIMDAKGEANLLARMLDPAAEPSPELDASWWLPSAAPDSTRFYTVASEQFVFLISFVPFAGAGAADDALLLDIARQVQARGGGPPLSDAARRLPPEIAPLLVSDPPDGYVAADPFRIVEDTERYHAPGVDAREAELFARESTTVVRTFTGTGSVIVVTLTRQPYEHLAAAELGIASRVDLVQPASLPGAEAVRDAVTFRIEPSSIGIIFRRGEYLVQLQGGVLSSASDAATHRALVELATRQAGLLPTGDTAPYFFPSTTAAVATAVGVTSAICLAIAAVGWIAVVRSRRRRGTPEAPSPDVIDVSPAAARRRWDSVLLTVVQVVAVNVVVVGLLFVIDGVELWSAATVAAGVALGLGFTSWRAHVELRPLGSRPARRRVLAVSGGALVAGLASGVCLVTGAAMAANGLESLVFGPTLRRLERSVETGISPTMLSFAIAIGGTMLLLLGGVLLRVARRHLRASAGRVRAADHRRPVLYLRSFEDDDDLRVATIATPRRPFLEMLRPRGRDPFEEALAWELTPHGPVVAVGRPGRALASLGAARDHLRDDEWREGVSDRMADAAAIVVVIAATDGLAWEIGELARDGHLHKTVFVFPPTDGAELRRRWQFVDGVLDRLDVRNAAFSIDAAEPLTANLLRTGSWHLTVAAYRDEASYCAAIDVAMSVATSSPLGVCVTGSVVDGEFGDTDSRARTMRGAVD